MAEKVLHATDGKANFQRLARLLVCGGITLLREVFDSIHPPANLSATLNNPTTKAHLQRLRDHKKVITQLEWKRLYPSPGVCGKSTDFDITLLFKLFRNICSLAPPVTGWDILPNTTDHSREADLVRIKFYRNEVYGHSNDMEIADARFDDLWTEIGEALLRIACSISGAKKDEWEKAINKFRCEPLTPDADRSVIELKSWCKKDMDTKEQVEKVNIKLEQMDIKQREQMNVMSEQLINIRAMVESLKPCGSSTNPGHLSSAPQLPEAGLQPESVCIPIVPEQQQAQGAMGLSTGWNVQATQQTSAGDIDIWRVILSFKSSFNLLIEYLRIKLGVDVQDSRIGSLVITVSCSSVEVLERLWKDYTSGHLNDVVQETLVTGELLNKLCLSEVRLKTVISEKEYNACKEWFMRRSGKTKRTSNCL